MRNMKGGAGGVVKDTTDLSSELEKSSKEKVSMTVGALDPVLYVFTSGTTGLPKAAVLKHSRYE